MPEERDPKVSQRYRELGGEEPPRQLDAAILAAARRAAETRPAPLVAPTGRRRWYFPLAAAAIIVLAVAVTVQVERQQPDPEDFRFATPPAPPPPAIKEEVAKEQPKPTAKSKQSENRLERAPPVAPQAAPASPGEVTGDRAESKPRTRALGAASEARTSEESPERWLERIAELRKQGRDDEADQQLAEFKKRYPDYKIPEAALRR